MNIVYRMGTGEVIEKKSKFIAHVFHIKDEAEALVYINEVKKKILGCQTSLLCVCIREQ